MAVVGTQKYHTALLDGTDAHVCSREETTASFNGGSAAADGSALATSYGTFLVSLFDYWQHLQGTPEHSDTALNFDPDMDRTHLICTVNGNMTTRNCSFPAIAMRIPRPRPLLRVQHHEITA